MRVRLRSGWASLSHRGGWLAQPESGSVEPARKNPALLKPGVALLLGQTVLVSVNGAGTAAGVGVLGSGRGRSRWPPGSRCGWLSAGRTARAPRGIIIFRE